MKNYTLKCKDMGMEKCNFTAEGPTKAEVKTIMMQHHESAHPKETEKMMQQHTSGELDQMMDKKIKEERE